MEKQIWAKPILEISIKIHDDRKYSVRQFNRRKVLIPLESLVVRQHPIEQTPHFSYFIKSFLMISLFVHHQTIFPRKPPSTQITIKSASFMYDHHVFLVSVFHGESSSADVTEELIVSHMMDHVSVQVVLQSEWFSTKSTSEWASRTLLKNTIL